MLLAVLLRARLATACSGSASWHACLGAVCSTCVRTYTQAGSTYTDALITCNTEVLPVEASCHNCGTVSEDTCRDAGFDTSDGYGDRQGKQREVMGLGIILALVITPLLGLGVALKYYFVRKRMSAGGGSSWWPERFRV